MPHLSPLPWTLIPIILWLYLISYMIMKWFHPSLKMNSLFMKKYSKPSYLLWNWS